MTGRYRSLFPALLLGLGLSLAACENEIPTATGADRFPAGTLPRTVDLVLPATDFIADREVLRGFRTGATVSYLLVAERFGERLDAHALARFTGFPDSIRVSVDGSPQSDTAIAFTGGRVVGVVDTAASVAGPVTLRLWSLAQPWDPTSVTWELAIDTLGVQVPWRVPGGTPDRLLAEAVYQRGEGAAADTLRFPLDSATVAQLQQPGFPGLLLTAQTADTRLQLGRLALELDVRSSLRPDTALVARVVAGPQRFIFTPEPPRPDELLIVGGLTGDRTLLTLDLSRPVPLCDPALDQPCGTVPLSEVTLNRAILLLDPVPVADGFRPLQPVPLTLRSLLEPELGLRSSLGGLLALQEVEPAAFQEPFTGTVAVDLSTAVRAAIADESATVSTALLTEPEGRGFGYAWFDPVPRLRLIYTLPIAPVLP